MKKLKRFLNFRPLVLVFISLVIGIFVSKEAFTNNVIPIILCAVFLLFIIIVFILSCFKKDLGKNFISIFGAKSLKTVCIITLSGIIVGASLLAINFNFYSKRSLTNDTYLVNAKISEIVVNDNKTELLLKNVEIDNVNYNFKIKATINYAVDDISVGDNISFEGYFYCADLVQNGKLNTYILNNNLQYYCYINLSTLVSEQGNANIFELLKDKTKDILISNMSLENAGFCYATIFGNKSLLSDNYYDIFKNSGLAHILAISGSNIAFLVGIILFVTKLFKVRSKYSFWIIAVILTIYCILCDFSPSVFRACIMSLCLMLGMVLGERNDILSNLSLAGIIILLFQPLFLFDVGFLLSFCSVLGILLLNKPIVKILTKIKLPKFICDMISITISATLGIIPIMFSCFGEITLISIISNVLALPIINVSYIVMVVCTLFNLILPLPILLKFTEFTVNIAVNASALFANFAIIKTFDFSLISGIIYYLFLLFISPYFIMKFKNKLVCILAFICAFTPIVANENLPRYYNYNIVAGTGNVNNSLVLTTTTNKTILINAGKSEYDINHITYVLKSNKINSLDYLFLTDYKDKYQDNVYNIVNKYNVKNIIVFGNVEDSTKLGLANCLRNTDILSFCDKDNLSLDGYTINVSVLSLNDKIKAIKINYDNINVVKIESNLTEADINSNIHFFDNTNYCIVNLYNKNYNILSADRYICYSLDEINNNVICVADNDLWTF